MTTGTDNGVDPNKNYIEEGEVSSAFNMLTKQIHGIKEKVDNFIESNTPDDVKKERTKHRNVTVADLEERDDKLINKLTEKQKIEKAGERLAKDAGDTMTKAIGKIESIFKANDVEFDEDTSETFDNILNNISKPYIKKATDKNGFIDTGKIPWDKIVKESIEKAIKVFRLDLDEDEEGEDENMDDEDIDDEDDSDEDEDEDLKNRIKNKKKKGRSFTGGGISINSSRDFTKPGAIRELMKDIPKMTREEATLARMQLEKWMSRNPDLHEKVFHRGAVKKV